MENTNQKQSTQEESRPQPAPLNFRSLWQLIRSFLIDLLDIRKDTDKKATIQDIKDNISMKGHTAWILVFSILIASIGLNISSSAVVIGAMLISPLMGPILGVGLSIGINDIDTLKRSLINLGVMVGLSVLTSFIFFLIPIFRNETPEIVARTAPDVRDVFIAIAGGLALIIALSRRSQQTNTIAGVAIATALMPPLCTAGYGLATWKLNYFGGAIFLFTINTIFIALATFVIVKFLRFPMLKYINSTKRKRIARLASVVAFLVFAGSIYMFAKLFQEDQFNQSAQNIINDIKKSGVSIIDEEADNIDYLNKRIRLVVYGEKLQQNEIDQWQSRLSDYGFDEGVVLDFKQGKDDSDLRNKLEDLTDLYAQNQKIIALRDETVKDKEAKIDRLSEQLATYEKSEIPFLQLSREAQAIYGNLESLTYAKTIKTDFTQLDTLMVFYSKWSDTTANIPSQQKNLKLWLKTRLNLDTLDVVSTK